VPVQHANTCIRCDAGKAGHDPGLVRFTICGWPVGSKQDQNPINLLMFQRHDKWRGEGSCSFLRKEPKHLYDCACGKVEVMANTNGIASRAKVFWFFSSEKNCFLQLLFFLTYFSS
jgi:hypothetical protein